LIIDGNSLEQAVKATTAKTITPMTIVLFLFTPQNYHCPIPPAAEFGKIRLRIEETFAVTLLAGGLETMPIPRPNPVSVKVL
jgi:hypothetical protein